MPWQHAASGQRQPIIQVTFAERREPAFDVAEQVQAAVKRAISEAVVPLARARQPAVLAHPVRAIGGQRGALPLAQAPGGVVADTRLAAAPQAQRPTPPPSLSAQLLSAGLQEAAQATALAHPRITQQLVRERAAAGVPTTLAAIEAANVIHETLLLVVLLPMYALARVCGCSAERLRAAGPAEVLRHALRHTQRRWTASTLAGARRAWMRLLIWLEAHDVEHDGTVDGMTLGNYLDEVDASARARCAARANNQVAHAHVCCTRT